MSIKEVLSDKEEVMKFRPISAKNYVTFLAQQDPKFEKVKKEIISFVYKEHYYELVKFINPKVDFWILCSESEKGEKIELPPFLNTFIEKEVTMDNKYTTQEISRIK
jgi:hypothetical protein